MIKAVKLSKTYGDKIAVKDLSLNIPAGQVYAFLGPNGAGKTTTIKMLLGLIQPSSGEVFLFDKKITVRELEYRNRIGVVPEQHPVGALDWMTGFDYLSFFSKLYNVRDQHKRIYSLLETVGLIYAKDKKLSVYSKGMLQKLSVIRAILHSPDIIFLDEPVSGLDPSGIKQIRDIIVAENKLGRTIFISSHLLSEVEKICQKVAIIKNGALTAEGTMSEIIGNLSSETKIHVELESFPESLLNELNELPFVCNVNKKGKTLEVIVDKVNDHRKEISSFLFHKKIIPLSINESKITLEDAYVTITNDFIEKKIVAKDLE